MDLLGGSATYTVSVFTIANDATTTVATSTSTAIGFSSPIDGVTLGSDPTPFSIFVSGVLTVSAPGTVALRWAQLVSTASNTTLFAGSRLKVDPW